MNVVKQSRRTAWRNIIRLVAGVFLLFAFADLAFPQICAEDAEPLFAVAAQATGTEPPADSAPTPPPAEDCFCCCSHIVSEAADSPLAALAAVSESTHGAAPRLPFAPVQLLFHPPRLA